MAMKTFLSDRQWKIIQTLMNDGGQMTAKEIAEEIGDEVEKVRKSCVKLDDRGLLKVDFLRGISRQGNRKLMITQAHYSLGTRSWGHP